MNIGNALQEIITLIDDSIPVQADARPHGRIVTFNLENSAFSKLRNKGFDKFLGQHTSEEYLVTNKKIVVDEKEAPIIKIPEFSPRRVLKLSTYYEAQCPLGNEEKVVNALHHRGGYNAGMLFHKMLHDWTLDFARDERRFPNGFIINFFEAKKDLEIFLVKQAAHYTGLKINIEIDVVHGKLEEERIASPLPFQVTVKDYKKPLKLSFEGAIEVDEKHKIFAILYEGKKENLSLLIQQEIEHVFHRFFKLDDYCTHMQTEGTQVLTEHINEFLKKYGRRIHFLQIDTPDVGNIMPNDFPIIQHSYPANLTDLMEPVYVENYVLLTVSNLVKYKNSGYSDEELIIWAKGRLNKIIERIFVGMSYKNTLLNHQNIVRLIEKKFQEEASSIGLTALQRIELKGLSALSMMRKQFRIVIENEVFPTADIGVNIHFDFIIRGTLTNLSEIKNLLDPHIDLESEIKEQVISAVERKVHDLSPHQLFRKFDFRENPEEDTVREKLEDCIFMSLDKFHIFGLQVLVHPRLAYINARLAALEKETHHFKMEVFPIRHEGNAERIIYDVEYKITGVAQNGWAQFIASSDYENRNEAYEEDLEDEEASRFGSGFYGMHMEGMGGAASATASAGNSGDENIIRNEGGEIDLAQIQRMQRRMDINPNEDVVADELPEPEDIDRESISKELKKIKKTLKRNLKGHFETLTLKKIKYTKENEIKELIKTAQDQIITPAGERLGLAIVLTGLSRRPTVFEEEKVKMIEKYNKQLVKNMEAELEELHQKKLVLLKLDPSDENEELKAVEKRLKALTNNWEK